MNNDEETFLSVPSDGLFFTSNESVPSVFVANVAEPPPSKYNASTHPIASICFAVS